MFEADPHVNKVKVAERTWFKRRPDRWGLLTAVWNLGSSLRAVRYDLGIDVRGDVLTVLVLALAGIPPSRLRPNAIQPRIDFVGIGCWRRRLR